MNTILFPIAIALLFGTYDLCIKLGAGRIDPYLGAMLTQTTSALSVGIIFVFQLNKLIFPKLYITSTGVFYTVLAGLLIAIALVLLFFLLQGKDIKATTTLPTILIFRNIVLVFLSIILLREQINLLKIIGIIVSLFGIGILSF